MTAAPEASRRIVIGRCPLCGAPAPAPQATGASLHGEGALPHAESVSRQPEGSSAQAEGVSPYVEADGFEWVRCGCGLVFKRSGPASEEGGGLDPGLGHYDRAYFSRYAGRRARRIRKSRTQILDALEVAPPGPLLDVGCSLGYALRAARSLGLGASGVDVSEHAIAECRCAGFDARPGTLTGLPFEDGRFAVVLLKHVFEHTPEPRAALRELKRVMQPGGAAFFAVPNLDYVKARRSPADSRFFRGEAGRAHYVYYTPATLSRLVESEGFRVASVHPRLVHRRAGMTRRLAESVVAPLRIPVRLAMDALGLRKEFWLVAVSR